MEKKRYGKALFLIATALPMMLSVKIAEWVNNEKFDNFAYNWSVSWCTTWDAIKDDFRPEGVKQ
jgi:hypothetical protein